MSVVNISVYLNEKQTAALEREVERTNKGFLIRDNAPDWTVEDELQYACLKYIKELERQDTKK